MGIPLGKNIKFCSFFFGLKPLANVFISLLLFFHLLRAKALHTAISTKQTSTFVLQTFVQAQITAINQWSVICNISGITYDYLSILPSQRLELAYNKDVLSSYKKTVILLNNTK